MQDVAGHGPVDKSDHRNWSVDLERARVRSNSRCPPNAFARAIAASGGQRECLIPIKRDTLFNADSCTIAGSDTGELASVKCNFLIRKLGLADGPKLGEAINAVLDNYGRSERNRYRAVVHYLLTKHFGKEAVYN